MSLRLLLSLALLSVVFANPALADDAVQVTFGFRGGCGPIVVPSTPAPVLCAPAGTLPCTPAPAVYVARPARIVRASAPVVSRVVTSCARPSWYDPPYSYRPIGSAGCETVACAEVTYASVGYRYVPVRTACSFGYGCSPAYGWGYGCGPAYGWGSACGPAYGYGWGCGYGLGWGYPYSRGWGYGAGFGYGAYVGSGAYFGLGYCR